MKTSPESCRRTLLICAAVIAGVGLGLAVGVIGPVAAEAARGGTPGKAVTAFWVNIGFALLSAVALFVIAKRPHGFGGLGGGYLRRDRGGGVGEPDADNGGPACRGLTCREALIRNRPEPAIRFPL